VSLKKISVLVLAEPRGGRAGSFVAHENIRGEFNLQKTAKDLGKHRLLQPIQPRGRVHFGVVVTRVLLADENPGSFVRRFVFLRPSVRRNYSATLARWHLE